MYPLDTQVRLVGNFETAAGVGADPSSITLYVRRPNQSQPMVITPATGVLRDGPGQFHYDLLLDQAGTWLYAWVGNGSVTAATFDTPIEVAPSVLHS